jgi:TPP-dependent pyruvate/acetoin dehydrogenase alpha subunit
MANKEATEIKHSAEQVQEILKDYKLARTSREMSLLGRKEVLTGKAKFGIFGDGKELPQIVMAKFFKNGDFRSGYYRDQTFMMAIDQLTVREFFAQLYAHPDPEADSHSAGRQMNSHFASRLIRDDGTWKSQTDMKNTSADLSPTAAQMARTLGLAQASKVYRHSEELLDWNQFSVNGNEIAWGTIGDASTSEGIFWETMNAAGVLQVPMIMSVWDDGYGISVAKKYQTTKESISKALRGFKRTQKEPGFEIFTVKAWEYEELLTVYNEAAEIAREEHVPVLIMLRKLHSPKGIPLQVHTSDIKVMNGLNGKKSTVVLQSSRTGLSKKRLPLRRNWKSLKKKLEMKFERNKRKRGKHFKTLSLRKKMKYSKCLTRRLRHIRREKSLPPISLF